MELTQWEIWTEPFEGLWRDLLVILPRLTAALALIAAGLLLGTALRATMRRILVSSGADERLAGYWVFQIWRRSHRGQLPSQALGGVAFYTTLFAFLMLALRALGAGPGEGIFNSLLAMFPRILSVLLILLLSGLMAAFVSLLVQLSLASSELPHAVFWGKIAAWGTFGAGVLFSLEPLGLAGQLLSQVFLILFAALALAAGLAFGIGCKDLAREFLLELLNESKQDSNP